jgi:hypothetical protein
LSVPKQKLLFRIQRLFDPSLLAPVTVKWQYLSIFLFALCININTSIQHLNSTQIINIVAYKTTIKNNTLFNEINKNHNQLVATAKPLVKSPVNTIPQKQALTNPYKNNLSDLTLVCNTDEPSQFLKSFVKNNYTKVENTILELKDSLVVYNINVTDNAVTNVTEETLRKIMIMLANNETEITSVQSNKIPLTIQQNGMNNLFFNEAQLSFTISTTNDNNKWNVNFFILNGTKKLAERFVTLNINKKLHTISL